METRGRWVCRGCNSKGIRDRARDRETGAALYIATGRSEEYFVRGAGWGRGGEMGRGWAGENVGSGRILEAISDGNVVDEGQPHGDSLGVSTR